MLKFFRKQPTILQEIGVEPMPTGISNRALVALAVMAVVLLALMTVERATAQDTVIKSRTNCTSFGCTSTLRASTRPAPREWQDLSKEERAALMADEEAREVRIAKWTEFCKPVLKRDEYGVGRYQYAHKGCEFGRSE